MIGTGRKNEIMQVIKNLKIIFRFNLMFCKTSVNEPWQNSLKRNIKHFLSHITACNEWVCNMTECLYSSGVNVCYSIKSTTTSIYIFSSFLPIYDLKTDLRTD